MKFYLFYHHSLLQSLITDNERATFAVGPPLQWQSEEVRSLSCVPATDLDPFGVCRHQREPPAPGRWVRATRTHQLLEEVPNTLLVTPLLHPGEEPIIELLVDLIELRHFEEYCLNLLTGQHGLGGGGSSFQRLHRLKQERRK